MQEFSGTAAICKNNFSNQKELLVKIALKKEEKVFTLARKRKDPGCI
jgi:hypothetical protein